MNDYEANVKRIIHRLEDTGGWSEVDRDILILAADEQLQLLQQMRAGINPLWYGALVDYWRLHPVGGE